MITIEQLREEALELKEDSKLKTTTKSKRNFTESFYNFVYEGASCRADRTYPCYFPSYSFIQSEHCSERNDLLLINGKQIISRTTTFYPGNEIYVSEEEYEENKKSFELLKKYNNRDFGYYVKCLQNYCWGPRFQFLSNKYKIVVNVTPDGREGFYIYDEHGKLIKEPTEYKF